MNNIVKYDVSKLQNVIENRYMQDLLGSFGNDKNKVDKFKSGVIYSARKTPGILNDPKGLIAGMLEVAQLGLTPGATGEAYILLYKGKAQAIIGYQGYIELLYRAGVQSIYSEIVYENDDFEITGGLEQSISHKIDFKLSKKARGEPIGCYVVVKFNGESIYRYMHKDDIFEFRAFSQSYTSEKGRKYSPWDPKNDPDLTMWKKTVLKQVAKYLPKTESLNLAIDMDNREAPVHENVRGDIDMQNDRDRLDEIFGDDDIENADIEE